MRNRLLSILEKWSGSETFWLLFFLLLVFIIRLLSLHITVIDWDESVYFTIAQDITDGGVPYKTSWDNKGPFLYFILVPIIFLFENSIPALRIFTSVYLLISMYFLYLLAGNLFRGFACVIPPLIYGLFFLIPGFGGFASNGELFMMLPVILALLMYIKYKKKGNVYLLFLSGLFSSLAFFTKGTAIFTLMVIPAFIIYENLIRKSESLKLLYTETLYFSLGFITPFVILNLYFWMNAALPDFYFANFIFNEGYLGLVPIEYAVLDMIKFLYRTVLYDFEVITLAAIASTLYLLVMYFRKGYDEQEKNTLYFILALSIFSAVGVLWGRRMFSHYYLQMGLAYSLLIAFAVYRLKLNKNYIKGFMIVILAGYFVQSSGGLMILSAQEKNGDWYDSGDIHEIADYVEDKTVKEENILVIGGQPIIYFLSDRKAPVKHFWWTDHHYIAMESILDFERTVFPVLNKKKPEYIIFYDGKHDWQIFRVDYFDKYIASNYSLKKRIGDYEIYELNK